MKTFTRRSLLAASAGALTLPLLNESLYAEAASAKRFVIFFVPEGVNPPEFWPALVQSPSSFELNHSLTPLEPIRQHCCLLKGFSAKTGFHGDGVKDMLTGGIDSPAANYGGKSFAGGVSVDRVLAPFLQGDARFASYDLGILSYKKKPHAISFDAAANPRGAVSDPIKAFDDLLAGLDSSGLGEDAPPSRSERDRRLALRKSVLDDVTGELAALQCRLGSNGRQKLEVHAESIRSVERQIDGLIAQQPPSTVTAPPPARDPTLVGDEQYLDPKNYARVGKLQMDILLTALAIDATRVATLQWALSLPEFSPSLFVSNLQNKDSWHSISHDGPGSDAGLVVKWHAERFAYFVQGLATRGLLADTLLLWVSEMSTGGHGSTDIPYITAGAGGGGFRTGLFLDAKEGNDNRFNNDLLAAIVRGFGVPAERFGKQREGDKRVMQGAFTPLLTL